MFNQVGGAAAEVLLKFCVVFVIALCSFAVGTFAGKKFTEDQHRLSSILNNETAERDVASVPGLDAKPDNALTDEDLKSLTEEFSAEEARNIDSVLGDKQKEAEALAQKAIEKLDEEMKDLEKAKEAATPKTSDAAPVKDAKVAETVPAKNKDVTTMVAERIVTNKEKVIVAPKKEVSRIPASYPSLQAASALGKYTVQVASYRSEEEAKAYAEDLNKKGYSAYYVQAELKGQTWYRVSVGSFPAQEEANKYLQKLYQEAKLKGFVTRITN